ncbi:MAG: glycoside hydrolase family protein, partial [Planctomycetaceae bacterium]|nr:glycoside hydrolase family protein [Planctomycetaceae bacterium]
MKRKILLAGLLLAVLQPFAVSGELVPADVSEFYVTPDQAATLRWNAAETPTTGQLAFTVFDVNAEKVSGGVATIDANDNKTVIAEVTLPQGYWEIAFDTTGERFGIVSQPAAVAPFDEFFAIDAALSWLVQGDDLREGIIKSAKRSGIGMMRERFRLAGVAPVEGQYDWQTRNRYDALRQTYKKHGVEVLEMSHDAPAWMGKRKSYPKNLAQYADAWHAITEQWQDSWGAVEVWNEPDIFFGGDLPADQYVALVKTLAYRFQKGGMAKPLVGGAVAHFNEDWINTAMANQLGELIDVFSFHTYDRAPAMEALIEKYQRLNLPLWLTECGRPWKKGPDRPPVEQDLESVTDIVMKGVESKCCGVARYFPFVLPYYEENDNNFGMLDRKGTPLRSMAGYAQMIRVLAHTEYAGDLKMLPLGDQQPAITAANEIMPPVMRARVFRKQDANDDTAVIVLYTGIMQPTELTTTLDVLRAESVTGESLPTDSLMITNGLIYVYAKVPENLIDADTKAMAMLEGKKKPHVKFAGRSPLVTVFDDSQFESSSAGYRIKCDESTVFQLPLTTFNLATDERDKNNFAVVNARADVDPDVSVSSTLFMALIPPPQTLFPRQKDVMPTQFEHRITFSKEAESLEEFHIHYGIVYQQGLMPTMGTPPVPAVYPTLSLRFLNEPTWEGLLEKYKDNVPLDISPGKWQPSSSGNMNIDAAEKVGSRSPSGYNDGVILKCVFGDVDKWCYPRLAVPEEIDLTEYSGVILRGRAWGETTPRFFLYERDTGAGYMTE